jgi:putative endonuclease
MKLFRTYYVYIVECSDKSYYIGITNDLDKRIAEHNSGLLPKSYMYEKRPVVLKYFERFQDVKLAIAREKQLKGWSRKKKEALILENLELLKQLSMSSLKKMDDSNHDGYSEN